MLSIRCTTYLYNRHTWQVHVIYLNKLLKCSPFKEARSISAKCFVRFPLRTLSVIRINDVVILAMDLAKTRRIPPEILFPFNKNLFVRKAFF